MRTKEAVGKKNHLSSKDKAVSCCEGLVNIHHCEKPLVKLSGRGGCGPTLITAGIWKLWLQLRQNKICIAVSVQPARPNWKSCVVVAHLKGSCGRGWTRSAFKVQERSKRLNQRSTREVVMCITEAVAVCLPVSASPDTSSRYVDGVNRRIFFYLEDVIITTGCQRCGSFLCFAWAGITPNRPLQDILVTDAEYSPSNTIVLWQKGRGPN